MIPPRVTAPLTLACQRSNETSKNSARCIFSLEAYSATAPTREPIFQLNAAWVNHTKRAASFWTN